MHLRPDDRVTNAVRHYERELRAQFGNAIRDVLLFGSHARHEQHEDSDIDTVVITETPALENVRDHSADIAARLTWAGHPHLSVIVMDDRRWSADTPFNQEVRRAARRP